MSENSKINNSSFLPNFCSADVLFIVILSAELLAIILTLALPLHTRNILLDLAMNSLFIQWIALTCVGLLCIFRHKISLLSEPVAAIVCFLLIIVITLIITELAWLFLYDNRGLHSANPNQHILFTARSVSVAAIVGAIVLRYLYVQHQWRKNIETTATSRFQALQSRIRPHFLFNCMNTIASLTRKSPQQAEQSIEDLADLFRASLLEPVELVKLSDEWRICETYLRIEQLRLDNRLKIEWDINTLPNDALIPPLSLQPLLENAIYHGIERLPEGGAVRIAGAFHNDQLIINIINPLPPENIE
ncbi:MAG: histidine kinase, partial [Proteobacteria bacterium]|nr:histidine kinase [Pseudomonadota bacterium]